MIISDTNSCEKEVKAQVVLVIFITNCLNLKCLTIYIDLSCNYCYYFGTCIRPEIEVIPGKLK